MGRFVWHRRGEIVGHTPVDEEIKDGWYFELVGRDIDISHLTTEFPGEPHRTLHIEGKPYLTSLRFAAHNELRTVREEALELIGMLNRSLGAVAADFNPVRIGDVVVQIVDGTRPPKIYVRVGRRMREESVPLKVLLMNWRTTSSRKRQHRLPIAQQRGAICLLRSKPLQRRSVEGIARGIKFFSRGNGLVRKKRNHSPAPPSSFAVGRLASQSLESRCHWRMPML